MCAVYALAQVEIRKMELDYYMIFFQSFGFQSALILVYESAMIEQTPWSENHSIIFFDYVFFIATAVAIITSLHIWLSTM